MLRKSTASRILALEELIGALGRRVPHVERAGEMRIARDAQILRREAVARLDELKRVESDDAPGDRELVEASLERWKIAAPPTGFRKLVAGKKLWNFQRSDRHLWKSAL
jgi:hypothetical protein